MCWKNNTSEQYTGDANFKPQHCGNNFTICKIRNSNRIRIITESETGGGGVKEMDLTERCYLGTKEGTVILRKSVPDFKERDHIRLVDVEFPTSVLKVHRLIYFVITINYICAMTMQLIT